MWPSNPRGLILLLVAGCTQRGRDGHEDMASPDSGAPDSASETDDTDTAEDSDTDTESNIDPGCPWLGDPVADRKVCGGGEVSLDGLVRAITADVDGVAGEDLLLLSTHTTPGASVGILSGPVIPGTSGLSGSDSTVRCHSNLLASLRNLAFGDVTGDGLLDVVLSEPPIDTPIDVSRGPVSILSTPLSGALSLDDTPLYFDSTGTTPYSAVGVHVADFDADGVDDVMNVTSPSGDYTSDTGKFIFHTGPILEPEAYDAGDVVWTVGDWEDDIMAGAFVQTGDMDGDGIVDVVIPGAALDTIFILPGPITQGAAREDAIEIAGVGEGLSLSARFELDDGNGDGHVDALFTYFTDETIHVIKNGPLEAGQAIADAERTIRDPSDYRFVRPLFIADQDGDDGEEFAVATSATEGDDGLTNVYVVRSGGAGTHVLGIDPPDWTFRGEGYAGDAQFQSDRAGDLNGDGFDDFVIVDSRDFDWSAPVVTYAYVFFGPLF